MSQTAAGTIANRTGDIRIAAAMLALAYLRFMAEGDAVRASVVLFEFQRFFTENRRDIIPANSGMDGVPRDLAGTGRMDRPTHNAIAYVLWQLGVIPQNVAIAATQDWGAPILMQQVWPAVETGADELWWGAYRAALSGPAQDAGMRARTYVFGFVEGLHTTVPEPNQEPIIPVDAPESYQGPTIVVPGLVRKRSTAPLWGFGLAAGAGLLLLGGFLYRRRRRR